MFSIDDYLNIMHFLPNGIPNICLISIFIKCYFFFSQGNLNNTFNIDIQTVESSNSEIFPNSKSELFLKMTLLKQGLNVINITISSKAHRDMSKPSLSIEQLSVFNVSTDIIY